MSFILRMPSRTDKMDDDYTMEDAISVLNSTIRRKEIEIENLRKKLKRLTKQESINAVEELIRYLQADRTAYIAVVADMTDDDSLLEGLNTDGEPVDCPVKYDQYLNGLNADDLENELDAEEIRADYCDEVMELMYYAIGEEALNSKKMVKFLLDDPYALSTLGELIFYDDYLYDNFRAIIDAKKEKKEKKKAKKAKKSEVE